MKALFKFVMHCAIGLAVLIWLGVAFNFYTDLCMQKHWLTQAIGCIPGEIVQLGGSTN